jgi:hypothetical protein
VSALAELGRLADPELRPHAVTAPRGGRYDGAGPEAAVVLEAVREGYEMHYGEPRAFAGMDADTRLLAGDALYALGLARLAERGDLEAIAELADLISGCARAHAEGAPQQAGALWERSAARLADSPPVAGDG